jgi:hypothetical protein
LHWSTDRDPAFFRQDAMLNTVLTVGTFTSFFKDNKSLRSHETVEIKVFLHFLLVDGRIRIRISTKNYGSRSCARIYRPSFHENKPKTLVFTYWKTSVLAGFRENRVYNFGHWRPKNLVIIRTGSGTLIKTQILHHHNALDLLNRFPNGKTKLQYLHRELG